MKNIDKMRIILFLTVILGLTAVFTSGSLESSSADAKQAIFSNGMFRITTGGRYIISGKHEGQILIQAERTDVVELVLDNLTLHNPNGPAVYAPRSRSVELILPDGSVNIISDGRHPSDEDNAVIFIQHDLIISGNGTLNINSNFNHGIRSQDTLTIKNGVINIKAAKDTLRGRDAVIVQNGIFSLTAGGDGIQSNNDTNARRGYVTINGGAFTINAGDDGIQAESAVTINSGSLTITAKDDGITTRGSVLITGGTINITECYEGIEGLNVTITGGDINVSSKDDGINAREYGIANARGRFMRGGNPVNPDIYVRVSGGNIQVHALTDGIDSNNNVFLEGGTLRISGPSRGMEGAIDVDGSVFINGGRLITAGSVASVSAQSRQPAILVTYTQQLPTGALIEIRNTNGNTLLDYTSKNAFLMSGFTSPDFVIGKTYSLYVNRQKVQDITLNSIITTIGDNRFNRGSRGSF
ncbi:MAG: carbohydrate-binding domain-containing protein [Treponema sp.]|jgi:hypothetical protein|nr:carbohydrate-binding domain-containing protein [Treponema sp.]